MQRKKIFIVEDDANILYGLQAKLMIEGFSVQTDMAIDGIDEMMRKIHIFEPDFIILDLILPKIDGYFVLSNIKADQNLSKTPIFIFTNLSDQESKDKSKILGAEYYFVKNFLMIDDFVEKIKKIALNKEKIEIQNLTPGIMGRLTKEVNYENH